MRLVPKLTAAIVVGTCVVLAANGYLRVRREVTVLQEDRVRDHALLGRSLGATVAAVWRSDGRADALRVVEERNAQGSNVHTRWVDTTDTTRHADAASLAALSPGETLTQIARATGGEKRFTYTPVVVGAERMGYVELSESLVVEQHATRRIVIDTLLTTLTLILVCGVLSIALGSWLVGGPIRALSAKARRVGEGDFSQPLTLKQKDELGLLATEINAMCDRLTEATRNAQIASTARIAAIEQLRHADRLMTVGMLASGIAHELGTPLNVVSARAQMIAAGDTTPEETVDYARVIADASNKMAKIIRQLLAFARRKPAQKAPRDLRRIARDTIELLQPLAEKSGVHVELADAAEMIADVDADEIQQAMTNILVNAIHAMPSGGRVEVAMQYEKRATGDAHPGRFLVITIRDHGKGIAPAHMPHIFEPFFTTKDVGKGTGLGLSVTHGIIDDHGGFIDVQSAASTGSAFSIHLPAAEPR